MKPTMLEQYRALVRGQKDWITRCETSEVSYTGANGREIRQADRDELRRLEGRLNELEAHQDRKGK